MSCEKRRSICLVEACKNIGNHLFPTDEDLKAQWIQAIEYFKPGLTIRKYSKICSSHFKPGDFHRTPLSLFQPDLAPKRLKRTAVPSIFPWKIPEEKPLSSLPERDLPKVNITESQKTYARAPPIAFLEEQPYFHISPSEIITEDPLNLNNADIDFDSDLSESPDKHSTIINQSTIETENDNVAEEIEIAPPEGDDILFQERLQMAFVEKHEKSVQTEDKGSFSIHHIKNNDKTIHFYAGLEDYPVIGTMESPKPISKKMLNSPESCVDDNLRGVVAAYPALHLHPKHRVITVSQQSDSGRVAILGGGGSGHEPFATGYVGEGMLDGAVAGNVFASPPTGHVLYAIAHLHKYNSGGVLVILGNYTGDRLNFGKAIEKAKILGMKVEGLIVGEDVASSENKTGGRSMCGEVFFYKLCGAMAAKGFDLLKIRQLAIEANEAMATLGVCLTPCSLPGQPPLFEISLHEMELGAGVHGEAGIAKLRMATSRDTVALILDKIIAHLKLVAGEEVAVMIDNLGGTSTLEMNIISADTKDYLESKQISVSRLYSGHFKTSLEMQGFQLCLLRLGARAQLWRECLDAPAAAAWVGGAASRGTGRVADDEGLLAGGGDRLSAGPSLAPPLQQLLRGSLLAACEQLVANEALLNRLDSGCGDGDCGNTLRKFAQAITAHISSASLERPAAILWDLSEIAERHMGGTSGGIYSLGLSAASQSLASASENSPLAWSLAWQSAMDSITKYGGAEPGDRTMLDTLHSAWEAFNKNLKEDIKTLVLATAAAAEDGAKATARMSARAGRASYVSSNYTQDEDAGARAVTVWLNAILHFIAYKY